MRGKTEELRRSWTCWAVLDGPRRQRSSLRSERSLLPFSLPSPRTKRRWMMVNDTQTAGLVARCSVSPAHLATCERSSCPTNYTSRETQTRNVTVVLGGADSHPRWLCRFGFFLVSQSTSFRRG